MNESAEEPPSTSRRPTTVTAAAIFMYVLAVFNLMGALYYLTVTSSDAQEPVGTVVRIVGAMDLIIGGVQIYAGMKIWALEEMGRSIGVVISAIGIGLGVLALARGGFGLIVGLALNVYIFSVLVREREAFRR